MVAGATATVIVATQVYPEGTANLDEVAYLAQAEALADGRVTLDAEQVIPTFRPYLSAVHGDEVTFKYQPLWPALLAASTILTGTNLTVLIIIAALTPFASYLFVLELLRSAKPALIAAVLMVFTPMVWLQSGSALAYHPSLLAVTLAGALILRAERLRTTWASGFAGFMLGAALFHRPFDVLLGVGPVIVYSMWRVHDSDRSGRTARAISAGMLGLAPWAALFVLYNMRVTGSPWRLSFTTGANYDRFGFGFRASFLVDGKGGFDYTPEVAWNALLESLSVSPRFLFAAPLVLVGACWTLVRFRRDPRVWLLISMLIVVPLGHFFWWATENAIVFDLHLGLGPFYHYAMIVPLYTLAAWAFQNFSERFSLTSRSTALVALAALAWTTIAARPVLSAAEAQGADRANEVAAYRPNSRSLVLADPFLDGYPYVRVANRANLDGKHVVGLDLEYNRFETLDRFADRQAYFVWRSRAFGDPFGPQRLERVDITRVQGIGLLITVEGSPPQGRTARPYLLIDSQPIRMGEARSASLVRQTWYLSATDVVQGEVTVSGGLLIGALGEREPTSLSDRGRFECRFRLRSTGDHVEALLPCEGYNHYVFPDGQSTISRENLGDHLRVRVVRARRGFD
jgi:hypothetical protein